MKKYSIVVPIFNEEKTLEELYRRLTKVMNEVAADYEVIFVNDASTDRSLEIMKELNKKDNRINILNFSRNFGHQIAITAGTDFVNGDAVIWMDGDLQDPPEVIPRLIEKWQQGHDVVYATRRRRKGENAFKLMTAKIFYQLFRKITDIDLPMDTGDFRLIDRKVVEKLKGFKEQRRFVRGLTRWIGFNQTGIEYDRDARYAGTTKYSLGKMLKFSLDAVFSFSFFPVRLASFFGILISFVCFIYICITLFAKLFMDNNFIRGWASLIVTVLFLGGIQLISLGIIGEYIGRIYEEAQNRPLYLLKDVIGLDTRGK